MRKKRALKSECADEERTLKSECADVEEESTEVRVCR